ncbi:MAG TPA: class I SAM-dependent methyltransferase [Longimicrobium sp.]|nr:class I SAM-dependent methyltransferase [Longimicrobium sp.]
METADVCPACGESTIRDLVHLTMPLDRGGQLPARIAECRHCTHRFLPLTPEELRRVEEVYDDTYAGFREDPFFARTIRGEIAGTLLPRVPAPARVLDVGCGAGEFMRAAADAGYQVEGIDLSEAAAELCRSRGLNARSGDFLTLPLDGGYDLITMWDVVEHLREPAAFLGRARELLAPGGLLVLKIPGFGRLTFSILDAYGRLAPNLLGAPSHVQYFTPRSLNALLARCGYGAVEPLPPKRFRARPPVRTLKALVARPVVRLLAMASGNRNLYLTARAPGAGGPPEASEAQTRGATGW